MRCHQDRCAHTVTRTAHSSRSCRPMSSERPATPPMPAGAVTPITALPDPRVITILSTEHWSLLSARGLAYNEAFVRGGMFLTFLSMSFVALALLAQAMAYGD